MVNPHSSAIILAAGEGARFRASSPGDDLPKWGHAVGGKPILTRVISGVLKSGIREIKLIVREMDLRFARYIIEEMEDGYKSVCLLKLNTDSQLESFTKSSEKYFVGSDVNVYYLSSDILFDFSYVHKFASLFERCDAETGCLIMKQNEKTFSNWSIDLDSNGYVNSIYPSKNSRYERVCFALKAGSAAKIVELGNGILNGSGSKNVRSLGFNTNGLIGGILDEKITCQAFVFDKLSINVNNLTELDRANKNIHKMS